MSEVSICNSALAKIGVPPITSFGDGTTQSDLCSRQYATLRDEVLEERAWTFATGRQSLLPDATDPAWGFGNRFLIPTTWLRLLFVTNVIATPGNQKNNPPLDWKREGQYILADVDTVHCKYVQQIADTSLMSTAFRECLAYRIAADFAIPLKKSNSLMTNMMQLYQDKLIKAGLTDGAQGRREEKYTGSFVLRR